MKKENWNNITKESHNRFTTISKIGGKKDLIRELKKGGLSYNDTINRLVEREDKIGKYKNTYYWIE